MASAMTVSSAASPDGERRFELFYGQNVAEVRRVVRRHLWGPVVDDVVQETFAQAYRSELHMSGDQVRTFKMLMGIARNRSIDVLRRRLRGMEEVGDDGRFLVSVAAPAQHADPELVLLASRRRHGIAEAMDSLNERQRRILFMHYVDGRRYEDIAAEEGITVDAVKAALARGRRSFKDLYATIADREGLAVILGGLVGKVQARLRAARDRVAASVETMASGVTAASPAVANAFIAVVAAGSMSLALGTTAAAASEGGPPEQPPGQSEASAGTSTDDGGDTTLPDATLPGDDGTSTTDGDAPEEEAASPGRGQGPGEANGEGPDGEGPPQVGRQEHNAEAEEEVEPTPWTRARGRADNDTEVDPEDGSADNSLDAVAEATVDMVAATQEASQDVSVDCPEDTTEPTGDLTQDRPSQYLCPVVSG